MRDEWITAGTNLRGLYIQNYGEDERQEGQSWYSLPEAQKFGGRGTHPLKVAVMMT